MHLVDFGADTTTVLVYKNNILRYLSVLPLGGNSIIPRHHFLQMEGRCRTLKLQYGDALYEGGRRRETLPYVHVGRPVP